MKRKRLSKAELIDLLIDDDVKIICEQGEETYLCDLLRDGFCGYAKQSYKELLDEHNERLVPQ